MNSPLPCTFSIVKAFLYCTVPNGHLCMKLTIHRHVLPHVQPCSATAAACSSLAFGSETHVFGSIACAIAPIWPGRWGHSHRSDLPSSCMMQFRMNTVGNYPGNCCQDLYVNSHEWRQIVSSESENHSDTEWTPVQQIWRYYYLWIAVCNLAGGLNLSRIHKTPRWVGSKFQGDGGSRIWRSCSIVRCFWPWLDNLENSSSNVFLRLEFCEPMNSDGHETYRSTLLHRTARFKGLARVPSAPYQDRQFWIL